MEIQNRGKIGAVRTPEAYSDMLSKTNVNVSMSVNAKSSVAVTVSSTTGQQGVGVGVPKGNVLKVAVRADGIKNEMKQNFVQMSVDEAAALDRIVSARRFDENPTIRA